MWKLAIVVATWHAGLLQAIWCLTVNLADNGLPHALHEYFDGYQQPVLTLLAFVRGILAFPLVLAHANLGFGRMEALTAVVLITNSLLWGFSLVWVLYAWRRRHPSPTAGVDAETACVQGTAWERITKGNFLLALGYLVVLLVIGPVRLQWGWQIMNFAGIDPEILMQRTADIWDKGAVVAMVLDIIYYLGPAVLAVAVYRRSTTRAALIACGWFVSLLLFDITVFLR